MRLLVNNTNVNVDFEKGVLYSELNIQRLWNWLPLDLRLYTTKGSSTGLGQGLYQCQ